MILTIGHSTHGFEAFLALLRRHGVGRIADVRTVPKSRRHPHFGGEMLAALLASHAIDYRHFPALGGLRRPRADSINTAWQHPGFRGYADHMQTADFAHGLDALLEFAHAGMSGAEAATAVMCAESRWWQCHRRLLADALLVRGVPVRHILAQTAPQPHELTEFARVEGGKVIYPGLL